MNNNIDPCDTGSPYRKPDGVGSIRSLLVQPDLEEVTTFGLAENRQSFNLGEGGRWKRTRPSE